MFGVFRNRRVDMNAGAGAVAGAGAGAGVGPAGDADVGGTIDPKDDGYFSETTGQEDDDVGQEDDQQVDNEGGGQYLTADEMIAAYDKTYLAKYPDHRLEDVIASHKHLRQWNYCPTTGTYQPRTHHELQWLDVHGHDADVPNKADTPSTADQTDKLAVYGNETLHKMYLSMNQRVNIPHSSPIRSSKRESLRHIAESEDSSSEMESISPAKNEIMRMLHDTHDPTLEGVRRSSQH